jgi:hypothetical protein
MARTEISPRIEMAHFRFTALVDFSKVTGARIVPEIEMTRDYHRHLKYLLEDGTLGDYRSADPD